jgi:ATP-dependent Clp protease ATP-binding subunit ClpC
MIEPFQKMTDRSRRVVQLAEEAARALGHSSVRNEHLLLGLAKEGQGVAANILKYQGADHPAVLAAVQGCVASRGCAPEDTPPLSHDLQRVLQGALQEAFRLSHHYIGTEHLFLAVVASGDAAVELVLGRLGLETRLLREETLNLLGHEL